MKIERRNTIRFDIISAAILSQEVPPRQQEKVLCRNIGIAGACFLSKRALPVGSSHHIKLLIPSAESLNRRVRVMWQNTFEEHSSDSKQYAIGVSFLTENGHAEELDKILLSALVSRITDFRQSQIVEAVQSKRWRFPDAKFIYEKTVFLKHTNMEGNTYYDNYVAWHGEAREALLLSHPNVKDFFRPENFVKMITHSLYQHYIRDSFFGNVIRIEVTSKELKQCSFALVFRYFDKQVGTLIGEGWQKICFANPKTAKICRVPQLILDLIEPIQEDIHGEK